MGTVIDMVSIALLPGVGTIRGTLWLSKKAALSCLKEYGLSPSEIELVVYAGIYRDRHIGEPSIASLLQKGIGINTGLFPIEKRTFSFDLNGGGCGMINAFDVVRGFIESGRARRGLVLTGDTEPIKGMSESFNFKPSASAVLLSRSLGNEGFGEIRTYTYPEYSGLFTSFISWKRKTGRLRYRNILVTEESDNYLEKCLECSIKSLNDFLSRNNMSLSQIKYIIPSQSPHGFPERLESELGGKVKVICLPGKERAQLHTSGPAFALRHVWSKNEFKAPGKALFLTVGSGITNAIALYSLG